MKVITKKRDKHKKCRITEDTILREIEGEREKEGWEKMTNSDLEFKREKGERESWRVQGQKK